MKLLFDQNLSHRLCESLGNHFSQLEHVRNVDLHRAVDSKIWEFALQEEYVIVTKDSDFWEQAILEGPPPKVVWIQIGNCTTKEIQNLLIEQKSSIENFESNENEALLTLSQ